MAERVTVSVDEGVADVKLNRPEKLNGLDLAMFEALVAAGKTLAGDRSLRAVVLSGAGRAFSAGASRSRSARTSGSSRPTRSSP